jgi:RES domain-containing protein
MRLWRLARRDFARDLSGLGAKAVGGRWNDIGSAVVYAAEHLSLALVEVLAHYPRELRDDLPEYSAVEIDFPDGAGVGRIEKFPPSLKDRQLEEWCQKHGRDWLTAGEHLALRVPSVIVPQEYNLVLNVSHRAMAEVSIRSAVPFRIDGRLLHRSAA